MIRLSLVLWFISLFISDLSFACFVRYHFFPLYVPSCTFAVCDLIFKNG